MPLCQKRNLLFIHIPKCAGTSIEVACGWSSSYPRIGLEPTQTTPHFPSLFGGGLQHLTVREIRENYLRDEIERYFCFTVLRDPFHRLVSHFLWRFFRFQERIPPKDELIETFQTFVDRLDLLYGQTPIFHSPQEGFSFNGIELDLQFAPNSIDRHLLPQTSFIFDRGSLRTNLLCSHENLEHDFEKIANRFCNINPLERRMEGACTAPYMEFYHEKSLKVVKDLYRHDISLFNGIQTKNEREVFRSHHARSKPSGLLSRIRHFFINTSRSTKPSPSDSTICQSRNQDTVIPKSLYLLWYQGWDQAPPIVKKCLTTWQTKNPNWNIHLLDASNLSHYINLPRDFLQYEGLPLCALSDVIRIHLLARYGGVWADATLWCHVPLDRWLHQVTESGFFAFNKPGPDRPLSSWFLAAEKGHYLTRIWLDKTLELWLENDFFNSSKPMWTQWTSKLPMYFWFHSLFQKILDEDQKARNIWAATPKISADGPHQIQFSKSQRHPDKDLMGHISNRLSPVFKLNFRTQLCPQKMTGLDFLLEAYGPGHDSAIPLMVITKYLQASRCLI